jgi:hypothetical protein
MIPSDSPRKPAATGADRERQRRHREEQREDPAPLLVGAVVLQERRPRSDHHRAGEADQRHAEHGRPRRDVRHGVDEDRQVDEAEHDRAPAEQGPRRPARPAAAATKPPRIPPMACADETVPRVAALPSRTSFTYGVNRCP